MDVTNTLNELEALAAKMNVEVVYDHFTGDDARSGGLCKLKGRWRVIIERRSSATEKASVLAQSLARFDLEDHFLSPTVRALVEKHKTSTGDNA